MIAAIAEKRVQRSQRSYGNTTAAIIAIVAIKWKPGFRPRPDLHGARFLCLGTGTNVNVAF